MKLYILRVIVHIVLCLREIAYVWKKVFGGKRKMRNRFVQTYNPRSKSWVLIDRLKGKIIGYSIILFNGVRVKTSYK